MIHALARLREVRAMLEPPPYGGQIAKVRAKAALLERDLCALADELAKYAWGDAPCVVSGGADGGCPTGECDPAREPAPRDVPNGGEVCAKVEAARAEVLR